MRLNRVLAVFALLLSGGAAAQTWTVPQELWAQPRTGTLVRAQPALRQSVGAYLAEPESRLVIHYGAGEEAALQAEELRTWLVALAVEAGRIGLARDLKNNESMNIELITTKPQEDRK